MTRKSSPFLILLVCAATGAMAMAGASGVVRLDVKWTVNTSAIFEGKFFGAGHQGCQTVWDIDGDAMNEIVFGTRRGDSKRLWCFDANQNLEWIYPPIDMEGLPGDPVSKVSLVDVNRDGKYELCFAGRGGRLHVLDGYGHVLWTWDNPNIGTDMIGAPQAFDVNGDGFVEFFMNDLAGYIHCVSHDGRLIWTSFKCGKSNDAQPTIADIDQDGEYEVLWASQDHNLYCMDAKTGREKWSFDIGSSIHNNVNIVMDVNRDGEYEALTWNDLGQVLAVSFFGIEIWRLDLPRPVFIRMSHPVGDVDGDGSLDMAIVSEDALYLYDIGGAAPARKWEINLTKWSAEGRFGGAKAIAGGWSSYTLIADINGDGKQEILWQVPFPMVTDVQGNVLAYYYDPNIQDGARAENGGWWGDVDKDGKSEWIVELNGKSHPQTQVYCLTMNGRFPADSYWPEYYHSAYPGEYQNKQNWLTLKAAYSNSLWFPMSEATVSSAILLLCSALWKKRCSKWFATRR